ncbi:MAG: hypothetical protein H7319_16425 [Spirosoma sp.]|nr:hypothetical protein [Spirosoma sp.]
MKSTWITWLIALVLTAPVAWAQDGGRQKIESAKIGMITNRLNLTPDQATQFWPVYNEYSSKKQELNRRVRQLRDEPTRSNLNDDQLKNGLREANATKQKIADLDNEYMDRFLKVITPKQLNELYQTERDFNKILLNQLNQN